MTSLYNLERANMRAMFISIKRGDNLTHYWYQDYYRGKIISAVYNSNARWRLSSFYILKYLDLIFFCYN